MANAEPHFSPVENVIAYVSTVGNFDIWRLDVDSGVKENLTQDNAIDDSLAWSADGQYIAYRSDASGNLDIWSIRADGSDRTNLTREMDSSAEGQPAWSPDGRYLAFTSATESSRNDVWIIDLEQNAFQNITEGLIESRHYLPGWSPDSRYLSIMSGFTFSNTYVNIYDLHLNVFQRLADDVDEREDRYAVWSPNGEWIALSGSADSDGDVWIARPSGEFINLTDDLDDLAYLPVWSPDSSHLAFQCHQDICLVRIADRFIRRLTEGNNRWVATQLDYSHDGQFIAFTYNQENNEDIWIVNVVTSELINLTNTPQ